MGDRTYARFSIPLSVLADARQAELICAVLGLATPAFQRIILADPASDEATGYKGTTVRLVDGRPCLVHEDPDANYGGADLERVLTDAEIPFLLVHGAGDEYGPAAVACLPQDTETIRVDHLFAPVVGIGIVDGRIALDHQEIRDVEHYHEVRRAVLQWPARAA